MIFRPTIWHPIAVALSALNLLGAGFAVGAAEPGHAAVHAALALAFGWWAHRLRQGRAEAAEPGQLEALEDEVNRQRLELGEMQERLDFAERVMAQRPEPRQVDPER